MKEKLAVDGGKPVRKESFPQRIIFDGKEKQAVIKIIEKTMKGSEVIDLYGLGSEIENIKKEFARYYGVKYAAAVSSGTGANHSAISALELEPGSEIITTPITDPGTITPILMQNCVPVFADVDYETLNISPESIEKRITKRTKAIIPVHLAGQPCDMGKIMSIARKHNLFVIEDCAQAHGAKYNGKYAGTIGHMGTFSLMGGKHITSGGQGGMVITNNEELYWKTKRFADRGKPFNSKENTNVCLGLNYRMTELEATIGRVQLKKLNMIVKKRQSIVEKLKKGMGDLQSISFRKIIEKAECSFWFCFLRYNKDRMKPSIEEFAGAVSKEGIPVAAHYHHNTVLYDFYFIKNKITYGKSKYPWIPYNKNINYPHCCPDAERALNDYITLPIHEGWTDKEIEDTIKAFRKVEMHYLNV